MGSARTPRRQVMIACLFTALVAVFVFLGAPARADETPSNDDGGTDATVDASG